MVFNVANDNCQKIITPYDEVIQDEIMECQKAVEQKCFIAQETIFKSYKVNLFYKI